MNYRASLLPAGAVIALTIAGAANAPARAAAKKTSAKSEKGMKAGKKEIKTADKKSKKKSSDDLESLLSMDLTELAEVEVTSVSKKAEKLSETTAAIHVITQDDMRRFGVRSLPEALRLAPGVHVEQIKNGTWAVSIRGFTSEFSNKLLVLVDGRTVYNHLFAGTYWDGQMIPIEEVERIEVINGPGAVAWGSNAVNGVINIITKHSKDTQDLTLRMTMGNQDKLSIYGRYGDETGKEGSYRVYGRYENLDAYPGLGAMDGYDESAEGRAGFRADLAPSERDTWTILAGAYKGQTDNLRTAVNAAAPTTLLTSINEEKHRQEYLQIAFQRKQSKRASWRLQGYYDFLDRKSGSFANLSTRTWDMDFQYQYDSGKRTDWIGGLNWRNYEDSSAPRTTAALFPLSNSTDQWSAFAQTNIKLHAKRWRLTLGAKVENNDLTGTELLPNLRVLYTPNEDHSAWAAVSRAVRTASQVESGLRFLVSTVPAAPPAVPLPIVVQLGGAPNWQPEELIAYEAGVRVRPSERANLDFSVFYHDYDNLSAAQAAGAPVPVAAAPPYLLLTQVLTNSLKGKSHGLEFSGKWQLDRRSRLTTDLTFMSAKGSLKPGAPAATSVTGITDYRKVHAGLRLEHDLNKRVSVNPAYYFASARRITRSPAIKRLDVTLNWRVDDNQEAVFGVTNMGDNRHAESPGAASATGRPNGEVPRSAFASWTWKF